MQSVVLSIRGWDGTRILGVYSNVGLAKAAASRYAIQKSVNTSKVQEEFILDVVDVNNISQCIEICASPNPDNVVSGNVSVPVVTRRHIY